MENCEAYTIGKAFDNEYKGDINTVLCEIKDCPYKNSGQEIKCLDGKTRKVCIANGLVKKTGEFIQIGNLLLPKSKSLGCITSF
jgi:hypothetical protein